MAVTAPAPPKCEAFEQYNGEGFCSVHKQTLLTCNSAKDAEIAELRALFGRCDCAGCVWFARARAALALMDEADWHVEAPKGKA